MWGVMVVKWRLFLEFWWPQRQRLQQLLREVLLHVAEKLPLFPYQLQRRGPASGALQAPKPVFLVPRSRREEKDLELPGTSRTGDNDRKLLAPPSLPVLRHLCGLDADLAVSDVNILAERGGTFAIYCPHLHKELEVLLEAELRW